MGQRKHDDAHRPMGGRGQRGNRPGKPANWGGAQLVEHKPCQECGCLGGHWPQCSRQTTDGVKGLDE